MELREFVRETLSQIIMGITEAQQSELIHNSKAAIVPVGQGIKDDDRMNQVVDFDVAVTAQSGTKTKGGLGIFVGPISVGTSGASDQNASSLNRIRFSVPVYLPSQRVNRRQE